MLVLDEYSTEDHLLYRQKVQDILIIEKINISGKLYFALSYRVNSLEYRIIVSALELKANSTIITSISEVISTIEKMRSQF